MNDLLALYRKRMDFIWKNLVLRKNQKFRIRREFPIYVSDNFPAISGKFVRNANNEIVNDAYGQPVLDSFEGFEDMFEVMINILSPLVQNSMDCVG